MTATTQKQTVTPETIITIYERRSVRKYKDTPVGRALIEKVIDAGRMAPSALNKQPWQFYVVTNKETIHLFSKEISKVAAKTFIKTGVKQIIRSMVNLLHFPHGFNFLTAADPVFHGAPVVIFIAAAKDNEWAALDIGMCSQNMMLAAKSMGLDSCPVGFGKYITHTKCYPQLHLSPMEEIHLALIMGYGDESPEAQKRNKNNLIFFD